MKNITKKILLSLICILSAYKTNCLEPEDPLTTKLKNEYAEYCKTSKEKLNKKNFFSRIFHKMFKNSHYDINQESDCPELYNMTKEIADKLNLYTPQIKIQKGPVSNAYAYQKNVSDAGVMTIGEKLITDPEYSFNYDELQAVVAHELGHLQLQHVPKRVARIKKQLAILLAAIPVEFALFKGDQGALTVTEILKRFAFELSLLKFTRSQEYEADLVSAKVTKKPKAMISALDKIIKMRRLGRLSKFIHNNTPSIFNTHPSNSERDKYLEENYTKKVASIPTN